MKNMKKLLLIFTLFSTSIFAQLSIDTLAIQDFDSTLTPFWNFTGPIVYNQGTSSSTAAPANSPIGLGGSKAWETTQNSGGLVLTFDNVTIPSMYDSVRVKFRLAAMNLIGTTGGPDNLDYVLTELSTDGGSTYYNRLRIRGAVANNCFWPYSATGIAKVYYQPQSEVTFAPTNSGLQTTEGYSSCEIVFPGSITQVRIRITGRSSSSTDTWLVDNVMVTGERMITSINKSYTQENIVKVYPNPVKDIYTLKINDLNSGILSFKLYNILGDLVDTKSINSTEEKLNRNNLPSGTYFYTISSEENGIISSGKLSFN
jgi:hypothetical protein